MAPHTGQHRSEEENETRRSLEPQMERALVDPYQVLGVPRTASPDDIKKAYFASVRDYPPEREPELFKRIRAAYDMLRTPEAKAASDLFMLHPPVPYEPYKRPPAFNLDCQAEDWLVLALAFSDLGHSDVRSDFREPDL
jgi:hypothetical protein